MAASGKRPKHIPQRTCVGCRSVNAKRQLVRVVRTAEGLVRVDPTGKVSGRGAYVHTRRSCWETALNTGALDRALKMDMRDADRAMLRAHGMQYADDDL
jgi:predicted RNA-binding protein YlxR (DUF448 family)